jgi:putative peptidoglycan lipid II flippase
LSETNLGKTTVSARPRPGGSEQQQITKRAGIVAAGTLASRLLGLVRDQTIAAVFPRAVTDAFFVAFTIPNVLRQLLAEGAVQSAVLPVLTQTRETDGEAEAKRFFRATRGLSLSVLFVTSLVGVLLAPQLVELFATGYAELPGQTARTVQLTRWVFPYIFFMGTAALGTAALNTHQRFVATSFAPGLLNVAFIVCSLTLPAWLKAQGWDAAMALAIAVLLGGTLQVVAQWPSLRSIGYLEPPSLELGHPGVRQALARMLPVMFGMGVYYIDVVLARRFLSEEGLGAQSYYGWALRLCDFPQGIFVMALQTAALPSLSKLAARGELGEVSRTFSFGMRLTLFVSIAATALFVGLAEPLVVLLFQRGEFDATSAQQTARALMAQGAGIWLVASVRQLTSTYYALGDTRTPVLVASIDLCAFVGLSLLLRGPFGHVGIGMAVTGSSLVQAVLLWFFLAKKLPSLRSREIGLSAAKTLLAAVAGLVAGRLGAAVAPGAGGALGLLLPGLLGSTCFILTFFALAWGLRSDELTLIAHPLLRRLRKKPAA